MNESPRPRSRGRGNRTGYTTGANAAAAATAATLGLITGQVPNSVNCRLPNRQMVTFSIADSNYNGDSAQAVVIKDAGDDPDVTHGAQLIATVRRIQHAAGVIQLTGGAGIGIVTQPGLGLTIGEHAINPVPRRNITANVKAVAAPLFIGGMGLKIELTVPDGERLAQHTLNARLGILNGISILGTTGIVRPYSTAAFRASLIQAIQVAAYQPHKTVVFSTGGRTEHAAQAWYSTLPPMSFIQMGDFIKAAFTAALRHGMTQIIISAMIGKLTKIAQGLTVTHAWRAPLDRELIAQVAAEVGAPAAIVTAIRAQMTARFAAEQLQLLGLNVALHQAMAQRAWQQLRRQYPGDYQLQILACDLNGEGAGVVGDY
ncbi:cobalt-precorrin-5B (C(1))-methyltransferase [Thiospirillum jenense]|uniref:Cobalt-precorrin-5B C(1)-methyltransferase n=1 Tax=Thiospirillum jenense TaxID=1653858 RepID=A0A839HAT8_9GAMM|nr:cobalt-precorrin-5B (C(1))-methyltransferase [Thiospirillum jenense]MBB1126175.1 cobalt-precorrin-5B (C(1))-methyltransferase [Thiospirillum jenense]